MGNVLMSVIRGVSLVALIVAGGCRSMPSEPITFDFKWFEGEPAYAWLTECLGDDYGPGDTLTTEDLEGMSCVPPDRSE